jgi:hypothetical protein
MRGAAYADSSRARAILQQGILTSQLMSIASTAPRQAHSDRPPPWRYLTGAPRSHRHRLRCRQLAEPERSEQHPFYGPNVPAFSSWRSSYEDGQPRRGNRSKCEPVHFCLMPNVRPRAAPTLSLQEQHPPVGARTATCYAVTNFGVRDSGGATSVI